MSGCRVRALISEGPLLLIELALVGQRHLGLLALFGISEELRLLYRIGREEGSVVAALSHGQRNEPLIGQLELAAVGDQNLRRDLALQLTHRFERVDRQVLDRTARLWSD